MPAHRRSGLGDPPQGCLVEPGQRAVDGGVRQRVVMLLGPILTDQQQHPGPSSPCTTDNTRTASGSTSSVGMLELTWGRLVWTMAACPVGSRLHARSCSWWSRIRLGCLSLPSGGWPSRRRWSSSRRRVSLSWSAGWGATRVTVTTADATMRSFVPEARVTETRIPSGTRRHSGARHDWDDVQKVRGDAVAVPAKKSTDATTIEPAAAGMPAEYPALRCLVR
jgi:hypothetical protein